jgi:hypothetical protein
MKNTKHLSTASVFLLCIVLLTSCGATEKIQVTDTPTPKINSSDNSTSIDTTTPNAQQNTSNQVVSELKD